jgi:dTDP-4-dehydrorhamnose reductase
MNRPVVIFTGGTGLLGRAVQKIAPDYLFPAQSEFDVTRPAQMETYAKAHGCDQVIHAAAFTSPPVVDKDPIRALEANIVGTANIVRLCAAFGAHLIYLSTDYVFDGQKGNYTETDPVSPVNRYAWSKLGGECAVRLYDRSLIIRTSFGPNVFPYEKAFVDQWTSREAVSVFASKLVLLARKETTGIIHVGGERRTVFQYARSLDPERIIGEISIKDVSFRVPVDTSLNCEQFKALIKDIGES